MTSTESRLYPSARNHPSHVTTRCEQCGSPLLVRVDEPTPRAVSIGPSWALRVKMWLRDNLGTLVVIACMVAMLWFVGGGWVWVPR